MPLCVEQKGKQLCVHFWSRRHSSLYLSNITEQLQEKRNRKRKCKLFSTRFLYFLIFSQPPLMCSTVCNMQRFQHKLVNQVKSNINIFVHAFVFLVQCATPKRWQASDGTMTQMDTLHTIRARELRDLYCSLTQGYLSKEERLDVLLTLKHTVKVNKDLHFFLLTIIITT